MFHTLAALYRNVVFALYTRHRRDPVLDGLTFAFLLWTSSLSLVDFVVCPRPWTAPCRRYMCVITAPSGTLKALSAAQRLHQTHRSFYIVKHENRVESKNLHLQLPFQGFYLDAGRS